MPAKIEIPKEILEPLWFDSNIKKIDDMIPKLNNLGYMVSNRQIISKRAKEHGMPSRVVALGKGKLDFGDKVAEFGKYTSTEELVEAITKYRQLGYKKLEICKLVGIGEGTLNSRIAEYSIPEAYKGLVLNNKEEITQKHVVDQLTYNEITGLFYRNYTDVRTDTIKGDLANHKDSKGYIIINLYGKAYKAHQLVILYIDGYLPISKGLIVDHKNGIRDDNIYDNLEAKTQKENMRNQRLGRRNTSGYTGVMKDGNKWKAQIQVDGNKIYGGLFDKAADASDKVTELYREYGFDENHGNVKPDYYSTDNSSERKELIKKQTPKNVNKKLMKAIWENCPEGWHVDHIHPLSKSGLNEPDNLQYLTKEDNLSKSNRLDYKYKTKPIRWQDVINEEDYEK